MAIMKEKIRSLAAVAGLRRVCFLGVLLAGCVSAMQWDFEEIFDKGNAMGRARVFSSAVMYSADDGPPSIIAKTSYTPEVELSVAVTYQSSGAFGGARETGSQTLIGFYYSKDPVDTSKSIYVGDIVCNNVTGKFDDTGQLTNVKTVTDMGKSAALSMQSSHTIMKTGFYFPVVSLCSVGDDIDAVISGQVAFVNPYGYLPASLYGFLPLYASLAIGYILLGMFFGCRSIVNRKHLLRLHLGAFLVIIVGMIECMSWFLVYLNSNRTGELTCCPVTKDARISLVLKVFKTAVSRVLLLVVSLGYGITTPKLSYSVACGVAVLALVYTGSSLIFEVEHMKHIEDDPSDTMTSFWSMPVNVCDFIFLCWTYLELVKRQTELKANGQSAKLEMYNKLVKTLLAFVALWFVYAILIIASNQKYVELESSWHFLVWGFYDVMYYLGLVVICMIWLPNARSAQYAYSQQLPTEDPDDFTDDAGMLRNQSEAFGLEMVGNEAQFEIAPDDDDDGLGNDEEDDETFDVDFGMDGNVVSVA